MRSKGKNQSVYQIIRDYDISFSDEVTSNEKDALAIAEEILGDTGGDAYFDKDKSNAIKRSKLIKALPWNSKPPIANDIKEAQVILDKYHYGMNTVKQIILEQLAMLDRNPKTSNILCFVGPPGTGKITIFAAIAEALGRPKATINCQSIDSAFVLNGSSPQWNGSDAGMMIKAIVSAGSFFAAVLLDEIDKLGNSNSGPYSNAESGLLQLLDDQKSRYVDHFLGVPIDLSGILFVATANDENKISAPLRDRMQIIKLGSYTVKEKEEIVTKYIIPELFAECNVKPNELIFSDSAIKAIVKSDNEAGVRRIKQLAKSAFAKGLYLIKMNDLVDPLVVTDKYITEVLKNLDSTMGHQKIGFCL